MLTKGKPEPGVVNGARGAHRPAVGREIRRWRRARALTLAQVSEASGLNIGYLSQIENDKALPSLEALTAIAAALDVPAAWLLLDSSPPPRVVRRSERPRIPAAPAPAVAAPAAPAPAVTAPAALAPAVAAPAVAPRALAAPAVAPRAPAPEVPTTPAPAAATVPAPVADLTEVDAGTSRDLCIMEAVVPPGGRTGPHAHAGDEHHVVLSGRWRMTQGEHTFELGPGDYLAWDPSVPHDVENIGDEPGRLLLIYPRHTRRLARDEA